MNFGTLVVQAPPPPQTNRPPDTPKETFINDCEQWFRSKYVYTPQAEHVFNKLNLQLSTSFMEHLPHKQV